MPALSSTSRFMKIGIASDTLSLRDLSMISYWKIRARLLRVPGVSNVMIYGERIKMYAVQVEPDKLVQHKVPLTTVHETIGDALDASLVKFSDGHFIGSGGFIDTPNQRLQVRYVLPIVTPDDLSKVTLKDRPELKLTDVARVVEDNPPLIGDAIINDGPGILLIVEKFPWANTLDVTRGTDEALKEIAPGLKDVKIDAEIFRPATFIEVSIGNLTNALVLGSILVVVLLFFFLFEWRTALISVHRHSAVAADRRIDPRSPWRNHQRDDPRRLDHCGRRSGRRRDHRHREHLATSASETRRGKHSVPCRNHPGCLARGQGRHRLRDHDGDRRARPGVLLGRAVGRILPAARTVLHDRHSCLDGRRPHGHAGARLSSSAQRTAPGSL